MTAGDALLVISLAGIFLAGVYIRAGLAELRRLRILEMHRIERAGKLRQGVDFQVSNDRRQIADRPVNRRRIVTRHSSTATGQLNASPRQSRFK